MGPKAPAKAGPTEEEKKEEEKKEEKLEAKQEPAPVDEAAALKREPSNGLAAMLYSKKYPSKRLGSADGQVKVHDGKASKSLGDQYWTLTDEDETGVYTLRNGWNVDQVLGTEGATAAGEVKGEPADDWRLEGDLNAGYRIVSVPHNCHVSYEPNADDAWTCSTEADDG